MHADDFATAGSKRESDWFELTLAEAYGLAKGGRLEPGSGDGKEGMILNRVIWWTAAGLECEADPRQAERLLEETGLEGANPVSMPGVGPLLAQLAEDKNLPEREVAPYRGKAARANYLSSDRPDIQFASKECCRWMSQPTDLGLAGLRRIARYLQGRRRLVFCYPF